MSTERNDLDAVRFALNSLRSARGVILQWSDDSVPMMTLDQIDEAATRLELVLALAAFRGSQP